MRPTSAKALFRSAVIGGLLLSVAIALLGGGIGYLVAGERAIPSALIGSGIAFGFSAITALSVRFGGSFSLGAFYAILMGGWLLKLLSFAVLISLLQGATFISGPVFFLTLVAAVLGGLVIDSLLVLRSRIPTIDA